MSLLEMRLHAQTLSASQYVAGRRHPSGPSEITPGYPPSCVVNPQVTRLVGTLERWDRLAFSRIQSIGLNATVTKLDFAVGLLLPRQSVLHPVLIVTIGEVLTGVGSTRLLTGSCGSGSLGTVRMWLVKTAFQE